MPVSAPPRVVSLRISERADEMVLEYEADGSGPDPVRLTRTRWFAGGRELLPGA